MSVSVSKYQLLSVTVNVSNFGTLVCHKVSADHQFANGTYLTTSALVLKFSAFFIVRLIFFFLDLHSVA